MTQKQTSSPQPTSTLDAIIAQKRLTGTWTLAELTDILRQLNEYQTTLNENTAKHQQLSKRRFTIGCVTLSGIFFLSVAAAVLFEVNHPILTIVLGIAVVCGIFALFALFSALVEKFRERALKKSFLCQSFLAYCYLLLMDVGDDIKRDSAIVIDLRLDPLQQKQYSQGKSDKYRRGAYYACYDYPFERIFLTMTARLMDGNRLKLACREVLIETKRTKKSASGRTKTKTKYKKWITCKMFVQLATERFACQELPPDREYRTFEQRGKTVLAGKFKQKSKGDPTAMPLTPQATLTNLLDLYGCVRAK